MREGIQAVTCTTHYLIWYTDIAYTSAARHLGLVALWIKGAVDELHMVRGGHLLLAFLKLVIFGHR